MEVSSEKLVIGFVAIFLLGVMFAVVNGIYTEEVDQSLPLIMYAISFVSIIIGGFVVMLFQWKINKVQLEKVLKILPEIQRKIVKVLIKNNNALEQNRIVALTGINKVKISRVLMELEQREVIKRTNLGNTKLIVLKI
ncbi:hypothetical protein GOV14_06055 [Candidatus Pacearchaeota archaeon]|nr:hypothetical protein [Candidatus Pacearchaeota archaeon]